MLEKKGKREWTNALCTAERAKKEKTDRSLSCTCLPERIEWKRGKGKEKLTGPERTRNGERKIEKSDSRGV